MAIRNIRTGEDPILRKISKPIKEITPRVSELIDDMIESLQEFNGVGLAAVQVGVLKRLCIICIDPDDAGMDEETRKGMDGFACHTDGESVVVINPEITVECDETQTGSEGCLSVPGKWGNVTRPMKITLRAFDRELKPYELKACGLLARAICHECDHMEGRLYLDLVEGELYSENDGDDE